MIEYRTVNVDSGVDSLAGPQAATATTSSTLVTKKRIFILSLILATGGAGKFSSRAW
jgi:hypothetical protein